MKKRSAARKASVGVRHALLKIKKKRRIKKKVKELKKTIRQKELLRKDLTEDSKNVRSKVAQEILGNPASSEALGGFYFQEASDIGMEQAKLAAKLERKRKQLKGLKKRGRIG